MIKNYRSIKNYKNFINERLGVPEGNIESAQKLFNFIIEALKEKHEHPIYSKVPGDSEIFILGYIDLKVGEIEFEKIQVGININFNDEDFVLAGMSVNIGYTNQRLTHLKYDKDKKLLDNHKLNINYVIIEDKTTWKDIHDDFIKEKAKNIGSLAHELKHIYDKFMFKKNMFSDIVSYNSFSNVRFGIKPIDEFIYLLYLTTKTESLVRSSEIAAEIKELDIRKSEFKEFLKSTRLYSGIKKAKNFSYDKLKKELYKPENINVIKKRLSNSHIDVPESDEEIVDFILKLTYRNIVGDSISQLGEILMINDPIKSMLGLIKREERDHYNKHIKKATFENKDKFFEYWEKKIIFEGNKVFKKISKLYDMCKDDENKLHDKISDKDKEVNKSIIDPKAHDKHIASEKSIKNYESFFNEEEAVIKKSTKNK